MDFANERYVRVYVRDTLTWELLGWEGQAVLTLSLRKLDRAGCLDIGDADPSDAVAAVTRVPIEVVRVGMKRILERGVYVLGDGVLVMPNFIEGQETPQSDLQRARESRARRRDRAMVSKRDPMASQTEADRHETSENVTPGHAVSRAVTPAVPPRTVPSVPSSVPTERREPPAPKDLVWSIGVPLLLAAGNSEPTARTFLGRMASDFGAPALAEALARAVSEKPAEPKSFIRGTLTARGTNGSHRRGTQGAQRSLAPAPGGTRDGWDEESGNPASRDR